MKPSGPRSRPRSIARRPPAIPRRGVARDGNREAVEADARRLMAEWEKEDRERESQAYLAATSTFGRSWSSQSAGGKSLPNYENMSYEQKRAAQWNKSAR